MMCRSFTQKRMTGSLLLPCRHTACRPSWRQHQRCPRRRRCHCPTPWSVARSMTIPVAAGLQGGTGGAQELHSASSWQHLADANANASTPGGDVDAVYSSVEYIFGFGSLVSHPGFEYSDVVRPCYIKGYRWVLGAWWGAGMAAAAIWRHACPACSSWPQPPAQAPHASQGRTRRPPVSAPTQPAALPAPWLQTRVLAGQHRPPRNPRGAGADRHAGALRGGGDGGQPVPVGMLRGRPATHPAMATWEEAPAPVPPREHRLAVGGLLRRLHRADWLPKRYLWANAARVPRLQLAERGGILRLPARVNQATLLSAWCSGALPSVLPAMWSSGGARGITWRQVARGGGRGAGSRYAAGCAVPRRACVWVPHLAAIWCPHRSAPVPMACLLPRACCPAAAVAGEAIRPACAGHRVLPCPGQHCRPGRQQWRQ